MIVDRRLMERRKSVAEDVAKRSVGRLLWFLLLLIVLGGLIWLALSPWLSVRQVRTAGVVSSDTHATLAEHGVVAGAPMIMIRTGSVEDALETDPWIAQARVTLHWPDEVIVRVAERVPVLWVESSQGWSRRAIDGVTLPGPDRPGDTSPRLVVSHMSEAELRDSPLVRGAAEFVTELPHRLDVGLRMRVVEGELWADTSGYRVRLGRPIEMRAKALSLVALLQEDIPEDAVLILVAPSHPAIEMPQVTSDEGQAADDGAG